jgi:oligopeptide transport system substrate-binding protein
LNRRGVLGAGSALLLGSWIPWRDVRAAAPPGVLRRVVPSEVTTLDPQRPTGQLTSELATELFAGLTVFGGNGRLAPGIAASWQANDRFDRYTFTLRPKLQWSDGRALTAQDVVFSIRRFLTPEVAAQQASRVDALRNARAARLGKADVASIGVSAPSANTVVFDLEQPDIEFASMLAIAYIVPQHVITERGQAWSRPEFLVSNGAYAMEQWTPGAKTIRLKRNPRFFDAANVKIERIEWHTGYDDATRLRMFRAGDGDVVTIEDSSSLALAKRDFAGLVRSSPEYVTGQIGLNLQRRPLQDVRVRRALALALDRTAIATRVRSLGERPSESFLPEDLPNYPRRGVPEHAAWPMPQRLQRARELMSDAGYRPGSKLELGIGFPASATGRKVYLAVAAMWKAIGVTVSLQPIEGRAYNAAIQRGDFDVFSFNTFTIVPSALVFFERFQSDSALNNSFYKSARFDQLLGEGSRATDAATRAARFLAAEQVLLQDYPAIPLFSGASNRLVAARVRGWQDHPVHAHPSRYLSLV